VTAASSLVAHEIIGPWPTALCVAAVVYVFWHENQTWKNRAREESEAYTIRSSALVAAEHEGRKAAARKVLIDALALLEST
jgi:hypothetical protein